MRAARYAKRSLVGISCLSAAVLMHILPLFGLQPALSAQSVDSRNVTVHDSRLSDIYFEFAANAYTRGNMERADELAETSLLFDRHAPDALFIRGDFALEQEEFHRAADYLSRALLYQEWRRFDSSRARSMLAAIYYRTGKAREAYHLLQPSFPSILNNPERASLYVRILGKLDFEERAAAAVRQAQAGFPAHSELQILRMRYDRGYGQRVIDTLLDGDPEGLFERGAHREALMLAFSPLQWANGEGAAGPGVRGLEIDNQLRRELLAGYERRWEPDRISKLYGLLLDARETGEDDGGQDAGTGNAADGQEGGATAAAESEGASEAEAENANAGRSEGAGKGLEELRAEWTRIASDAGQLSGEEFSILRRISGEAGLGAQRPADFSGELRLDTDRDGFVDRRIVYEAGELVEMSRDLDQNTRPEIIVTFRNGSPQRVAFHENEMTGTAHGEIVGRYGRYPNLVSASYVSADEKIDVELVPYEVDFDLLVEENWSPLSPPTIPRGIAFPSFDDILPYAAKVERSEGASTQTYSAVEGRSTLYPTAARDKSILGSYSGAELQRRMRDVDGDGFEEITEVYEQGELRVISFDGNGNNKAEYVERYEEDAVLRLWDIDEDGTFDYEMRIENRRADDEVEQQ